MLIHWLSPLPPLRTGIAEYTAHILPELARRAEVVLWTAQESWDPALESLAPVRRFSPSLPSDEFGRADIHFYNIGNNPEYHFEIWEMARKIPGVVILHDFHLQHFFEFLYRRRNDPGEYFSQMSRWHGPEAEAMARDCWDFRVHVDEVSKRFPLFGPAVEGCLGAIAHSPAAYGQLAGLKAFPVSLCHLPHPARPEAKAPESKWGAPPYRLVVFGFIMPNRRLEPFIEALAGVDGKEAFTLDIYGEVWDPDRISLCAQANGVGNQVHHHGYVTSEVLDRALSTAHLAINLRYPTMGEASSSQLRIWEWSLPSLVTRTGWYGSLPEEVVAKVAPENEIAQIRGCLTDFLADPSAFRAMGERGRALLERRHAASMYTSDLLQFADVCLARIPREEMRESAMRMIRWSSPWIARHDGEATAARIAARLMDFCEPAPSSHEPAPPVPARGPTKTQRGATRSGRAQAAKRQHLRD